MIRVRTASRLHFGLLSLPGGEGTGRWANVDGQPTVPARQFGGVGLMVERPGLEVTASPAAVWSADGPLAGRALAFADRYARSFPEARTPCRLMVEQAGREHAGLGMGTQLALAAARAVEQVWRLPQEEAAGLARRVGRGQRSTLGIHGFTHGGFLVEAGKGAAGGPGCLVTRLPFPAPWRIILAFPETGAGLHGPAEERAFRQLVVPERSPGTTEALCRLVLLGLLPALVECDLEAFGEALYDFNARVGEAFAAAQGGSRYAGPRVAEAVAVLRGLGARGVGQSSWGPAVFAVAADPDHGDHLAGRLREKLRLAADDVWVTAACNHGATVEAVIHHKDTKSTKKTV